MRNSKLISYSNINRTRHSRETTRSHRLLFVVFPAAAVFPAFARFWPDAAGTGPSTNSISSSSSSAIVLIAFRFWEEPVPVPVPVPDTPSNASTSMTSPAVETDSRLGGCAGLGRTEPAERTEDAGDGRREDVDAERWWPCAP